MSLLFPAYLVGLLGLALPWLLHRFSDQNPPEQLFPSKRFLEATTPPVSRKQTLRYRALLALRVMSMILLCLLFAQPWIKRDALPGSQQQHHIIVLDQTLSMRANDRWSTGVDKASELIAEVGNSHAQLVAFDSQVTVMATAASGEDSDTEGESLSSALQEMEPGYSPGDYGLLMQRLDRLAAEQALPVKVWLISDMQLSGLPAQLNALYAPNVDELELVNVNINEQINVHMSAEASSTDGATASISVSLLASHSGRESGNDPIERTVVIESQERELAQRTVSLRFGDLSVLTFDDLVLPAQSNPEFIVSIREPDVLLEDNRHRLPIETRQPTSIVLLSEPGSYDGSASVFVTTALETDGLAQVEPIQGTALQVSPDTPHLVSGRDLSEPIDMALLQYVDTGSNALVFNQSSYAEGSGNELEGSIVGVMDEAHPLALGDISWFGIRFYNLPEFSLQAEDRVLLQSADDQTVLIERQTNRGRLLILNDPLDGLASNLPLQPAFVALMQAVVRYFDASTSVPSQVVVGERLALPANVQLINTNGDPVIDIADRAQASTVALEQPGIYTVVSARGEQMLRAVLDASEADISPLSDDAMSAWQARYSADEATDNAPSTATTINLPSNRVEADSTRQTLWQWLLPLVALLLLAEGWFSNRRLNVRRDGS